ncbi:MAG: DUF1116 domain-containing protein [Burkholderiales bacterium]|nr:DUF1116 domain-containing protein [Burkholderiales bacterium]
MQLEQSFDLPVRREAAWAAFQDVTLLVSCLPGASLVGDPAADPLAFRFAVKLGPITANFSGQGKLSYEDGYRGTLSGGGTDRATGSRVKGSATFDLRETGSGTQVRLLIDYALTGALAQFSRTGIVRELADGITRQFAANLRSGLTAHLPGAPDGASRAAAEPPAGGERLDAGRLLWNAIKARVRGAPATGPAPVERDAPGLAALVGARPQWTNLTPAGKVVALDGRWLLHAGPPLADSSRPPAPVLSSAVLACLHEEWAQTEEEAERLVASGEVRLEPAQDHRCVTPLAAVVSPKTTLIVVEDPARLAPPAYAPLGTPGAPDPRFGTRERAILGQLARRDGEHARALAAALAEPVDLVSIAAEALAKGDDLHHRTTSAAQLLAARLAGRCAGPRQSPGALMNALAETPLFFLTFWMAAAKLILSAAERQEPRTLVTRMGGNGEVFGISLAAHPDAWITVPATAPLGPRIPGTEPGAVVLGAIGDDAVIDALGFGAQAPHVAPDLRAGLKSFLPPGAAASADLLAAEHPAFAAARVRVGLDAARAAQHAGTVLVTLAMVEATGRMGLLGHGVFVPGKGLFARAAGAIDC